MTPQEFMDVCYVKGGITKGIESGLDVDDLDDSNPEFNKCVFAIHTLFWACNDAVLYWEDRAESILKDGYGPHTKHRK